jgi:hypothetical protein
MKKSEETQNIKSVESTFLTLVKSKGVDFSKPVEIRDNAFEKITAKEYYDCIGEVGIVRLLSGLLYRQTSAQHANKKVGSQEMYRANLKLVDSFGYGYVSVKEWEESLKPKAVKISGKKETQVSIERWEVRAWIADNMPERLEAFEQSNDKALALAMKAYYTPLLCEDHIVRHMPTTATYQAIVAIDAAKKQVLLDEAARIKEEEKNLVDLIA